MYKQCVVGYHLHFEQLASTKSLHVRVLFMEKFHIFCIKNYDKTF